MILIGFIDFSGNIFLLYIYIYIYVYYLLYLSINLSCLRQMFRSGPLMVGVQESIYLRWGMCDSLRDNTVCSHVSGALESGADHTYAIVDAQGDYEWGPYFSALPCAEE